jgi:hypothetical protein
MNLDPVFVAFVKGFVLPVGGVALLLIQIGSSQRATNRLLFGLIVRLVRKGVFDASDLLEMGVLEAAQQSTFSGGDLIRLIAGALR